MKKTTTKITRSSGNVFSDLGFGKEEAQHLQIRSTLMIAIQKIIDERQLTQAQAADVFGVTQPRISDLVRGKIELFSIDMLVTMLARTGMHLQIVLSPVERGAA
jgi:predicted XRE-type DNA-binding protein